MEEDKKQENYSNEEDIDSAITGDTLNSGNLHQEYGDENDPINMKNREFQNQKEERDWKNTEELNTIAAYKAFISLYPDSTHLYFAKKKIIELKKQEEKQDLKQALQKNTIDAYQSFIVKHFDSKYVSMINKKINELKTKAKKRKREEDWQKVCNRGKKSLIFYYDIYQNHKDEIIAKLGDLNSLLFEYTEKGEFKCVRGLIKLGADVNTRNNDNETPLWEAASQGYLKICKLLVKSGAIWNEPIKKYGFPVSQAAAHGRLDVLKYFVEDLGFDVNKKDRGGWTLLHWATAFCGEKNIAEYLISKGADVNARDKENLTPLFNATYRGYLNICKLLVKSGAIWDEAVEFYSFPVTHAFIHGHFDVIKYFIEDLGFDVNKKDKAGFTIIDSAESVDRKDVLNYLKKHKKRKK